MSSNNKKVVKRSKFSRFWKTPIRFLIRARDFYIQSMNQCSVAAGYGSAMGCPTGQVGSALPRSFSVSTSSSSRNDDDYRELLRVASLKNVNIRFDNQSPELGRRQGQGQAWRMSPAAVPRSCSVGVGRIDEDKPCEFGDVDVVVGTNRFPRSKSLFANPRRTRAF